jgi:hypothetical protein
MRWERQKATSPFEVKYRLDEGDIKHRIDIAKEKCTKRIKEATEYFSKRPK